MGVRKLERAERRGEKETAMKEQIAREIRRADDEPRDADAPIVFMEEGDFPGTKRYYVVSDCMFGIDGDIRSEIVLDAIEEAEGKERVLQVTMAEGLTTQEARQRGLPIDDGD